MANQNNSNPRKRPREEASRQQRPLPAVPTYSRASSTWELPAQTTHGAQHGQLSYVNQYAQPAYGNQQPRPSFHSQQIQPVYGSQPARPSYNSPQAQPRAGNLQVQAPYGFFSTGTNYSYQQTQPVYGMQPMTDNNPAQFKYGNQQAQTSSDTSVEQAFSGSLWDDVIESAEANHRRRLEKARNDPATHQRALDKFRHLQPGPVLTDAQQRAVEARERLESLRHTPGNDKLSQELREVSITMRRINELRDSGELEFPEDESTGDQCTVATSTYRNA